MASWRLRELDSQVVARRGLSGRLTTTTNLSKAHYENNDNLHITASHEHPVQARLDLLYRGLNNYQYYFGGGKRIIYPQPYSNH